MRNMFKKCLAVCLVLLTVFSLMSVAAAAGESPKSTFSVGNVEAAAGKEVLIPVSFANNGGSGFGAVKLWFTLPNGWTLKEFVLENGGQHSGLQAEMEGEWISYYNPTGNVSERSFTIAASTGENITNPEAPLFWLVVQIPETASGEAQISVRADHVYSASGYVQGSYTNLIGSFTFTPGTVTVTGSEPEGLLGDVNGDGKLSTLDLSKMRKYLLDNSIEINMKNADIKADGKISTLDLSKLRKLLLESK